MLVISNRCHHIPLLFGFQLVLTQCHDTDSSARYHYEKEMVIVQWGEVTGRGHLPQTSEEKKGRKDWKRLKMVRERITDKDTTLSWIVSLIGSVALLNCIPSIEEDSPPLAASAPLMAWPTQRHWFCVSGALSDRLNLSTEHMVKGNKPRCYLKASCFLE